RAQGDQGDVVDGGSRALRVVGGVRVGFRAGHARGIDHGLLVLVDLDDDGAGHGGAAGDAAQGARHAVVGAVVDRAALAKIGRNEGRVGWQYVRQDHAGGGARAVVVDGDAVGQVAQLDGGGRGGLGQ